MGGDGRTTAAATAGALLLVAGLVGFQGLDRAARPGDAEATSAGVTATPSPADAPTPRPAPRPVPAGWTVVDRRPVGPVDLELARNDPVEDPDYPDTSNPEVDTLHHRLTLDWDGRHLAATDDLLLRMTRTVPELRLDLDHRLDVDAVAVDGHPVAVRREADHLVVRAPGLTRESRHHVVVRYSGTPTSVDAPTHRPDAAGGLGWAYDDAGHVSTYQEPYGAFTWYPVHDHPSDKAYYDVQVTAPVGQVGVSGGRLVGRSDTGGRVTTRWHLDLPAASYLTTMAIGPYRQHVRTLPGGVPVSVWTLPDDESLVPALQDALDESHAWLGRVAGPYPFTSSGIVVTAGQSAMETQTLITMGRAAARAVPREVTLHELAHQWYGDAVTTRDWTTTWLNEGWAMYWELTFRKDVGRPAATPEETAQMCADSVRDAGQAGDPKKDWFGDHNIYMCPAAMLRELRGLVGDAAFLRLAREWPAQHRGRSATRADFEEFARRVTGRDIRPLTRRWLDQVGTTPAKVTTGPAPAPHL